MGIHINNDNNSKKHKALPWVFVILLLIALLLGIGFLFKKETNHSIETTKEKSPDSVKKKDIYHCPMHPHIISDHPGTCPICHMDLQKVDNEEEEEEEEKSDLKSLDGRASFNLSQEKQQLIGVTSTEITKRDLFYEIRSSGRVAFDPELFTAIEEYKQALLTDQEMKSGGLPSLKKQTSALVSSSKTKLKLMGLSDDQIKSLTRNSDSSMNLLLPQGHAWIYAEVFEYEVAGLRPGLTLEATTPSIPGKAFLGKVESISPVVNAPSRTVRIRALVPDPKGELRPETFLNVKIKVELGNKLAVPEDSVLHSGEKSFVFVVKEKGRFEPRAVQLGVKTQDYYEVLSGLEEGEKVVTAANFLIDSESKLRGVLQNAKEVPDHSENK